MSKYGNLKAAEITITLSSLSNKRYPFLALTQDISGAVLIGVQGLIDFDALRLTNFECVIPERLLGTHVFAMVKVNRFFDGVLRVNPAPKD